MPKLRKHSIVLSTTISVPTYAALAVLAASEGGGRPVASPVITRLTREELERNHPGAWARAVALDAQLARQTPALELDVRADKVADALRLEMGVSHD